MIDLSYYPGVWVIFSALWLFVGMLLEAQTHFIDNATKWAAEKIDKMKYR